MDPLTLKNKQEYDELRSLMDSLRDPWPDRSVPTISALYNLKLRFRNVCPECFTNEHAKLEDHDVIWGDGDVVCQQCRTHIRNWDSG